MRACRRHGAGLLGPDCPVPAATEPGVRPDATPPGIPAWAPPESPYRRALSARTWRCCIRSRSAFVPSRVLPAGRPARRRCSPGTTAARRLAGGQPPRTRPPRPPRTSPGRPCSRRPASSPPARPVNFSTPRPISSTTSSLCCATRALAHAATRARRLNRPSGTVAELPDMETGRARDADATFLGRNPEGPARCPAEHRTPGLLRHSAASLGVGVGRGRGGGGVRSGAGPEGRMVMKAYRPGTAAQAEAALPGPEQMVHRSSRMAADLPQLSVSMGRRAPRRVLAARGDGCRTRPGWGYTP